MVVCELLAVVVMIIRLTRPEAAFTSGHFLVFP